jgi:hypothetical protein
VDALRRYTPKGHPSGTSGPISRSLRATSTGNVRAQIKNCNTNKINDNKNEINFIDYNTYKKKVDIEFVSETIKDKNIYEKKNNINKDNDNYGINIEEYKTKCNSDILKEIRKNNISNNTSINMNDIVNDVLNDDLPNIETEEPLPIINNSALRFGTIDHFINVNDFNRFYDIINVYGDGNCLFRALSICMGMDESSYINIKNIIIEYMKENCVEFTRNDVRYDIESIKERIVELSNPNEWGSIMEIYFFERIINCRIIIYEELYDTRHNFIGVKCIEGRENYDDNINDYITLLFCRVNREISEYNNHYNVINTNININGIKDTFKIKYINEYKEINDREWPKVKNPPGKTKLEPDSYISKRVFDKYTEYLVGNINNIELYEIVKINANKSAFYFIKDSNVDLNNEKRVIINNYLDRVNDVTKCYNITWKNCGNRGYDSIISNMDKNLYFNENILVKEITKGRYAIDCELRKRLMNCICGRCSGRARNKDTCSLFKYYSNAYEFFEHCRYHDNIIPKDSCINIEIPINEWLIVEASKKPKSYSLINRKEYNEIIGEERRKVNWKNTNHLFKKKGGGDLIPIKIYGWNARSLFNDTNIYYMNKFLLENEPDIVLINEMGRFKKNKLNNDYNIQYYNDSLCIIYRKDILFQPLWMEMWNKYIMIAKIQLEDKHIIIVNCYRTPSNDNHALDIINSTICFINNRFKDSPIVIFGDMNYYRVIINEKFRDITRHNYKILYSDHPNAYTRYSEDINGKHYTYIDYFIVKNIKLYRMNIINSIGKSDHLTLELLIEDSDMKVKKNRKYNIPFNRLINDSEDIYKLLKMNLRDMDSLRNIIGDIKNSYKPIPVKYKTKFKYINDLDSIKDWKIIKRIISNTNRNEFILFMEELGKCQYKKNKRDFYLRLKFYSELNSNTGVLDNIKYTNDVGEEEVTEDINIINQLVTDKYRKLFNDNGHKIILTFLNNKRYMYSIEDIVESLDNINLDKAMAYDYLPCQVYKRIKSDDELINTIRNIINELLCYDNFPTDICLSRLFCLNKNVEDYGSIDSIRPINISGVLFKIMEYPILKYLKGVILNKGQLGFREKLSTELNIMRLINEVYKLNYTNYDRKSKFKKRYLLFIDFKQAFDSVDHNILIDKIKYKLPDYVVNNIIILLNSGYVSIDGRDIINVNRGVGQGRLCSPLLFNIYVNDLLDDLDNSCVPMAYADDLLSLCEDYNKLEKTIDILETWCYNNKIEINKKKSGIIIINGDSLDSSCIRDYNVVNEYKYLGIMLNSSLNNYSHINNINEKIKIYLKRNKYLHREYFSVNSLLCIIEYFIKSRLSYGMCCFLNNKKAISSLHKTLMRHIKSILGLPEYTSHRQIQLVLGIPDIEITLLLRLVKNLKKYKEHFKDEAIVYSNLIEKYNDDINKYSDFNELKQELINKNIVSKDKYNVNIRDNHKDYIKKHYFNHNDKNNFYFIRYICNVLGNNIRLFPKCSMCGKDNSEGHDVDECTETFSEDERKIIILEYKQLFDSMITFNSIMDFIKYSYFTIGEHKNKYKIANFTKSIVKRIKDIYIVWSQKQALKSVDK